MKEDESKGSDDDGNVSDDDGDSTGAGGSDKHSTSAPSRLAANSVKEAAIQQSAHELKTLSKERSLALTNC